ncbi:MAG: hypothetical protein PT956_02570 [Firmicutes bacterium]|nr:hypothetical protein [Bacillota bacterium]
MIDRIIFAGDNFLSEKKITPLGDGKVLFAPKEESLIALDENSLELGRNLLELYQKYDIVYLDTRYLKVTDLGMGFLNEFGIKFLNNLGECLDPAGLNLYYTDSIDESAKREDLTLRLIMSRPREHCANPLCGRKFSKSPFEGELLSRAFHNLLTRLKSQGYDIYTDLRALEAGGFSAVVSAILRDDTLEYYRLMDVYIEEDHNIKSIERLEE